MATKRLIDANALLAIYKKWLPQLVSPEDEGDRRGVDTCIMVLEDAPTVDAVEVVRCKDCKYWNNRGCGDRFGLCEAWEIMRKADGYCDCGERKDDD